MGFNSGLKGLILHRISVGTQEKGRTVSRHRWENKYYSG